jgi:iron(III) transport system substrate-binding protein
MQRVLALLLVVLLGVASAQPSGVLRLYTSQPDADAAITKAAFEAAHPGVRVEIFRSGTEQVIARFLLEAEAGAPQADVLLVADAPTFELLKARNLLEAYPQAISASAIAPGYADPEGYYYGTKILATLIMYNKNLVSNPVGSWAELASLPSGSIVMPSPSYSGAAAYNLGVMTRDSRIGWAWFEALAEKDVFLTQGNGAVLRTVANGERPYGIVVDFLPIRGAAQGSPVGVVYPSEGVPVITEPVGIVKGTPNLQAARAFVDFLLSVEGQRVAVGMGYMPLRADVAPPAGFPALASLRQLTAPAADLAATRDADKERFGNLFGE